MQRLVCSDLGVARKYTLPPSANLLWPASRCGEYSTALTRCLNTGADLVCVHAGVGKGRQIAALIKALWLPRKTCRILWLSVSNDLREDARRDMRDLGLTILEGGGGPVRGNALEIVVWPKANDTLALPAGHKIGRYVGEGVLFGTYHMLIAGTCGVVSKSAAAVQKRKEAKQKYAAETP